MTETPGTTSSISSLLKEGKPIILDGALATYLEHLGVDISNPLWSASALTNDTKPIYDTHLAYYRAGANVAITSSYQASVAGLVKFSSSSEEDAKAIIKKSVEVAKKARDDYLKENQGRDGSDLFVAGSVGPYGAFLADGSEYRGDYSLSGQEFKDFHRGRMQALVEAGVDVLAIETIPSFEETKALVELLEEEFAGVEAWFSFTVKDAGHLSDGTPLREVVDVLEKMSKQVVAIGVNCVSTEVVTPTLQTLKGLTSKPFVVYPNSGEQWNAETRSWYGDRNEGQSLAERTKEWWNAGARLIGGCCKTTPDDIRVMADTLHASS